MRCPACSAKTVSEQMQQSCPRHHTCQACRPSHDAGRYRPEWNCGAEPSEETADAIAARDYMEEN